MTLNPANVTTGQRMQAARLAAGLSRTELATVAGLAGRNINSRIAEYEAGKRGLTPPMRKLFSSILKTDL